MGKPVPSLSRSPEESLAIGTAVLAQPAIDATAQESQKVEASADTSNLYLKLVNEISKGLDLKNWPKWTKFATGEVQVGRAKFEDGFFEALAQLRNAILPGSLPKLELSAKALGYIVAEAYQFHKDKPLADWVKLVVWNIACRELVVEATAAANWFADVVRSDLDRKFFLENGRFSIPGGSLHGGVDPCVYNDETRPKNLDDVKRRVADIVAPYRALVEKHKASEK